MSSTEANQYSQQNIETMEMLYGRGYLSIGGDNEVASIVSKVAVEDKNVLDIGCGLGGALITLCKNHKTRHVHGIDIDTGVLERAAILIKQARLQDRATLSQFEPGPIPLADESFDVVFCTAVSCHIEDLFPFLDEIRRVLRPGGKLIGGEWFKNLDNDAYRRWDEMLRERGLNFYFVTGDEFRSALGRSGFNEISIQDRTAAMATLAQSYLDRVTGELKAKLLKQMNAEAYSLFVEWTRIRADGLVGGGSGYGHFIASKQ